MVKKLHEKIAQFQDANVTSGNWVYILISDLSSLDRIPKLLLITSVY